MSALRDHVRLADRNQAARLGASELIRQHAAHWRRHAHLPLWRPTGWTAADCELEAQALEAAADIIDTAGASARPIPVAGGFPCTE